MLPNTSAINLNSVQDSKRFIFLLTLLKHRHLYTIKLSRLPDMNEKVSFIVPCTILSSLFTIDQNLTISWSKVVGSFAWAALEYSRLERNIVVPGTGLEWINFYFTATWFYRGRTPGSESSLNWYLPVTWHKGFSGSETLQISEVRHLNNFKLSRTISISVPGRGSPL